ncbi:shikimate dehydrogenase family protein [Zunongwangia sp.]|uniref:shikimate dehydrogenase family protein n=1 Tax=Zunongwangia sp. TaxID=1965325 RepID=UPI003AA843BB
MKHFGLLGKNIDYSFSRGYFSEKFQKENINADYSNFDIADISEFPLLLEKSTNFAGLNVTIPYKVAIIDFLDDLAEEAKAIQAVNVIKFELGGKLIGYNTDFIGFRDSIRPYLQPQHTHALILGTGGASKAIAYALKTLGISYKFVSRTPKKNQFSYTELTKEILLKYSLLINTTPLGTYPDIKNCPDIPYQFITNNHLVYDLIYNPSVTSFMQKSKDNGATAVNGQNMLELQAEAAWRIWNS